MAARLAFGYESDDERQVHANFLWRQRQQPFLASTPKAEQHARMNKPQYRRRQRRPPLAVGDTKQPANQRADHDHEPPQLDSARPGGNRRAHSHAAHHHRWQTANSGHKNCEPVYAEPDEHSDYASLIYSCSSTGCDDSALTMQQVGTMPKLAHARGHVANGTHTSTMSSSDSAATSTQLQHEHKPPQSAASASPAMGGLSASDDDSGCALEEYAWVPQGLRPDLVHQYFSSLPSGKVPLVNSSGERWRIRQLLLQLPPQDTEPRYCRHVLGKEAAALRRFAQHRKRDALGRATVRQVTLAASGSVCVGCADPLTTGELAVFAGRVDAANSGERRKIWHPACFTCRGCDELLVDLIYFHKGRDVYCGRHHAELFKPRCSACDELIFSDECTEAEGRSWHMRHFACFECDRQLGGQRYVMREHRPYCVCCYQTLYADRCSGCGGGIGVDQPHVSHEHRQWHATDPVCFKCSQCGDKLLGKPFLPRRGFIYCGSACCAAHKPHRDATPRSLDRLECSVDAAASDGNECGAAGSDDSSPGPLVEPSPQLSAADGSAGEGINGEEDIVLQLRDMCVAGCSGESAARHQQLVNGADVVTPRAQPQDNCQRRAADGIGSHSGTPGSQHNPTMGHNSSLETLSEHDMSALYNGGQAPYKLACNQLPCSARSVMRGGRIETTFDVNDQSDISPPPFPPSRSPANQQQGRRSASLRSTNGHRRRVRIVAPPTAGEQEDLRMQFQNSRREKGQRVERQRADHAHEACSTCSSDSDDSDPEYDSFLAQYHAHRMHNHRKHDSWQLASRGRTNSAGNLPKRVAQVQKAGGLAIGGSVNNTPRRQPNFNSKDTCIVS